MIAREITPAVARVVDDLYCAAVGFWRTGDVRHQRWFCRVGDIEYGSAAMLGFSGQRVGQVPRQVADIAPVTLQDDLQRLASLQIMKAYQSRTI